MTEKEGAENYLPSNSCSKFNFEDCEEISR